MISIISVWQDWIDCKSISYIFLQLLIHSAVHSCWFIKINFMMHGMIRSYSIKALFPLFFHNLKTYRYRHFLLLLMVMTVPGLGEGGWLLSSLPQMKISSAFSTKIAFDLASCSCQHSTSHLSIPHANYLQTEKLPCSTNCKAHNKYFRLKEALLEEDWVWPRLDNGIPAIRILG